MKDLKNEQKTAIDKFLAGVYVPAKAKDEYDSLLRVLATRDLMTLDAGDVGENVPFLHIITTGKGSRETFQGFELSTGFVVDVKSKYASVLCGKILHRVYLEGVRTLFLWEI